MRFGLKITDGINNVDVYITNNPVQYDEYINLVGYNANYNKNG